MRRGPYSTTFIAALACLASGCVEFRKDGSLVRCWADWNTLGRPALFCEQLSHAPPKAARVDYFRWMYGQPPGKLGGLVDVGAPAPFATPSVVPAPPLPLPPAEQLDPQSADPKPVGPLVPPAPSRDAPGSVTATSVMELFPGDVAPAESAD